MFFRQKEKRQLEESLAEIREQEEEMSRANRALTVRLEDVQVRRAGPAGAELDWAGLGRGSPHRSPDRCSPSPEKLDPAERHAQGAGGDVTRGEKSEGAVQEHEEQHRGGEEVTGPHRRETPERSECI